MFSKVLAALIFSLSIPVFANDPSTMDTTNFRDTRSSTSNPDHQSNYKRQGKNNRYARSEKHWRRPRTRPTTSTPADVRDNQTDQTTPTDKNP